jgi:hypothetical protein
MKIILLGADASLNNIGKTDVPLITTDESQAYFNAIPNAFSTMTTVQKQAVVNFFRDIKNKGIYSKITRAYLPIFGPVEGWVNMHNPSESLSYPSTGYGTYSSNGLTPIKGWLTNFSLSIRDMHWGFYNTQGGVETKQRVSLGNNTPYSQFLGRRVKTGNSGYLFDSSNQATIIGKVTSAGVIIGCNNFANSKLTSIVNGVIATKDTAIGTSGTTPVVIGSNVADSTADAETIAHKFFTFGTSLTENEMKEYDTLINSLMSNFF